MENGQSSSSVDAAGAVSSSRATALSSSRQQQPPATPQRRQNRRGCDGRGTYGALPPECARVVQDAAAPALTWPLAEPALPVQPWSAGAEPEQSCMPRGVPLAQPVTPYAVFLEHLSDAELKALAQRQQENHDRFREEWCGAGNPAPTTPPYDWPGFQAAMREARLMGIPIITV